MLALIVLHYSSASMSTDDLMYIPSALVHLAWTLQVQ